jgi:hypothetical protein
VSVFDLRRPAACPWCRRTLTAGVDVFSEETTKPSAGDPALCIECGKFSFVVGTSELRRASWEEFQDLIRDQRVMLAWLAWKVNKRRRVT